ncbi:dTDP-4-dehydrorhamnose 3,5-epimerase family protein [Actinoallomurus rhizosphaericola]|uniref:dTDP-4-dehydrorhamnose 3,5-epimerase family protein n=1 Tax=Actinoallomurus rhizosphaericola TaxID=2952536 RepID=UPI002092517A|nr:dTDP-4-dehydrorhamnose 3,5-epimerase family protein [Actinoallomurus rhizosphaericola]MCO5995620.1 dTDP-4-dehydrorhamnose 3,5-epimerase family protein [Actinoallomurus rhizosphaericola]
MLITAMTVPGAYRIEPEPITDTRGRFFESVRAGVLLAATGRHFEVRQVNYSVSRRNTLRGIHGTTVPPGQEKFITCVRGRALDIVVDIRAGSPTFGHYDVTYQSPETGTAVYLPDGFGHAFLALTDDTCMCYLCSTEYVPGTMIELDALDPDLALPWDLAEPPIRSVKDAAAPTLAQAAEAGLLPTYQQCPTRPLSLPDAHVVGESS